MEKNALVLGGGGAKGAYEVGVFKALKKLKFKIDIITGTSVGCLNGALFTQGNLKLAEKMWCEINTNKILDIDEEIDGVGLETYKKMFKHLFINRGFNYTSLENLLKELIDEKKVRKSKIDFGLITVKYPSLAPMELFKEEIENGKLIDYLLASAACFPAMKPRDIDGNKFIDGGYHNNLPIDLAIKKGATNIVAVDLEAIGIIKKHNAKNVKIIKSNQPLGEMLIFDKETAVRNIRFGYFDTLKAFDKLEGFEYAFKKGTFEKNLKKNYQKFIKIKQQLHSKEKSTLNNLLDSEIKKRFYQKMNKSAPLKEDYFGKILEVVMEILKFPVFEEYSYLSIIPKIKSRFNKVTTENISLLTEKLLELKETKKFMESVEPLTQIIKTIDRKEILKFIFELLEKEDSEKINYLTLLAFIVPFEIVGAIYLRCLYD